MMLHEILTELLNRYAVQCSQAAELSAVSSMVWNTDNATGVSHDVHAANDARDALT